MFTNTVKTEWIEGEERDQLLLEDVTYIDLRGVHWTAKAGDIIDGATIPEMFWSTVGPPFVGHYRRGSVIHDKYCKTKCRSYIEVHKMFKEAIIEDGVCEEKASLMYDAIMFGGPKW